MSSNRAHRTRSSLRVILVEDTVSMQLALQELVCAVVDASIVAVVASEAMATEWASRNAGCWDLAIVDLTLEQGDGFNIVRHLKEQPKCGVVLVFSAFVTEVIKRHCLSLGADAVFHKLESRQLADYIGEFAGHLATQ